MVKNRSSLIELMTKPIKILILGASNDQIKLIKMAKQLGYYVVDCDFTLTNPGLPFVDKHYQINYLDKDKVLKIAISEQVDGIISNSEQAMPIVAYVSEKLLLPGNSVDSVNMLADKTRFRTLQKKIGVYSPKHYEVASCEAAIDRIKVMKLPVLIKACECSASRGIYKVDKFDECYIKDAFGESAKLSWNGKVSIEEFVTMPSLTTYEGDIFVIDDDIIWDGIFYTQRSSKVPMIPMTYSGPLNVNDKFFDSIKDVFSRIFKSVGIRLGQYNVELYFTDKNEPFVIEINTRQGGRNLPEFIEQFSSVNLTKLLVSTCVGEKSYYEEYKNQECKTKCISHHLIFPHENGIFAGIYIDSEIENYVISKVINVGLGDELEESRNGTGLIGFIDFEFPNSEIRNKYAFCIEDYVYVMYL